MDLAEEQIKQGSITTENSSASLDLGLEDKMDVKVGVLSGGQRQAMALLMSTMTPIEFPDPG